MRVKSITVPEPLSNLGRLIVDGDVGKFPSRSTASLLFTNCAPGAQVAIMHIACSTGSLASYLCHGLDYLREYAEFNRLPAVN